MVVCSETNYQLALLVGVGKVSPQWDCVSLMGMCRKLNNFGWKEWIIRTLTLPTRNLTWSQQKKGWFCEPSALGVRATCFIGSIMSFIFHSGCIFVISKYICLSFTLSFLVQTLKMPLSCTPDCSPSPSQCKNEIQTKYFFDFFKMIF